MARSAVKIEPVVNGAAVHTGVKSTTQRSNTYSANSNPHALPSADRREEVVVVAWRTTTSGLRSSARTRSEWPRWTRSKDKSIKSDISVRYASARSAK